MRASRHFLQARLRAAADAQSPSHCVRGEGSSGKGSLARTPQPKKVTPVWSGTHDSFYDSKKSKKSWHETKPLINIYRTSELLCCQNRDKSWRDLPPAWRFSRFQQMRSRTSAVNLKRQSPELAISGEGHAGPEEHPAPAKCVCTLLWLDQTRQHSQVIFHPGLPEHNPLLGQIFWSFPQINLWF